MVNREQKRKIKKLQYKAEKKEPEPIAEVEVNEGELIQLGDPSIMCSIEDIEILSGKGSEDDDDYMLKMLNALRAVCINDESRANYGKLTVEEASEVFGLLSASIGEDASNPKS